MTSHKEPLELINCTSVLCYAVAETSFLAVIICSTCSRFFYWISSDTYTKGVFWNIFGLRSWYLRNNFTQCLTSNIKFQLHTKRKLKRGISGSFHDFHFLFQLTMDGLNRTSSVLNMDNLDNGPETTANFNSSSGATSSASINPTEFEFNRRLLLNILTYSVMFFIGTIGNLVVFVAAYKQVRKTKVNFKIRFFLKL